jgi:type I restriction enzyme S subunit
VTTWRPLKRFCSIAGEYGLNVSPDAYRDTGVRLLRTSDIAADGSLSSAAEPVYVDPEVARPLLLNHGDLLFSRSGTIGRAYLHDASIARKATFAAYLVRFHPRPDCDSRYLAYCSQATFFIDQILSDAVVSTIANFNAERYSQLRLPWAHLRAQQTIADFLDDETTRIDELITKKSRMIDLIRERGLAVGDRWVTSLFLAWGAVPLRRLTDRIEQGWSPQCESVQAAPTEWGVLKTSAVSGPEFRASENKRLPDSTEPDLRWAVNDGDLLITRGSGSLNMVGRVAVANTEGRRLLLSDLIYRLRLRNAAPEFIAYALQAPSTRKRIESAVRTDVGQTLKIRVEDIKDLPVPASPRREQVTTVKSLHQGLAPMNQMSALLTSQIALLQEHRQALITAAVSGQLNMSGAVA